MTDSNDAGRVDEHGRVEPPFSGDEATLLIGYLNYQRDTLTWKTDGLDDEQLTRRLGPSSVTLGGLLGHLAYVEDFWFATVLGESAPPRPWSEIDWDADPDWDWQLPPSTSRELWHASRARSDEVLSRILASSEKLDRTASAWGGRAQVSGRWVLIHMIEEYARHNGHADLLRESIDGVVGE